MAKEAIKNFLKKLKAMDSVPEEVVDAACEMADEAIEEEKKLEVNDECSPKDEDVVEETKEEVKDEEKEDVSEKIEKAVADAVSRALLKHGIIKDEAMKSLESLDEELEEDAEGEEDVTVDPEEIKSNDSIRKQINEVKPYIASIKDSATRKKIADSFAKLAKMNMATTSDYGFIQKAVVNNKKASDEAKPIPCPQSLGSAM